MKQLVFFVIAMFMYSATFAQVVKKPTTPPKKEPVEVVEQKSSEEKTTTPTPNQQTTSATQATAVAAEEQPQPEEKNSWTEIRVGISNPRGDFAKGKERGYGAGIKFYSPMESIFPNFSLVYGADVYYHALSSEGKKELDKQADEGESVTYPMYFNAPITVGGNIAFPLSSGLSIYGEVMAGVNISYITSQKWETDSNNKFEVSFEPAYGFCYGAEAGIVFNKKVSLGVRYNNLGSLEYKTKETFLIDGEYYKTKNDENGDPTLELTDGPVTGNTTPKFDLSNIVIVLGIRF